MRIAICDDEPAQVKLLHRYVQNWAEKRGIAVEIYGFASAEEYLMQTEDYAFDLLFLDIQMQAISGVELAKDLRRHDQALSIVFVTGIADHVFSGYEVSALHYLIKPAKEEDCHRCLDLAYARAKEYKERVLLFTQDGEHLRLPHTAILFIEATGHTLRLVASDKDGYREYHPRMSLTDLEQELEGSSFYRCHRSYLVNLRYITRLTNSEAILDDGSSLPISRQNREGLNQAFIAYYKGSLP